ncbi:MAG TPA: cohesin domain-containing protein [Ruminococcus sp.]|nr:cohesin domain-containing protein [Ruminococcus sp.]
MKNQKFLSLAVSALIAVSGVSGCLAVPAFCTSAESETLTFEMTNIDYNPKDSVQYVDVFVTQIPDGTEVYAMQGSISYDASALELVEVPADSCYGLVVTNESEGCLRWSIETNDPNMMPLEAKEGDTVIYFGFKVKDTANNGVYQIKWDRDYTMASSLENLLYGGSLPLTITDGSITVNRSTTTTTLPETTTTTTTTLPETTTTTTTTVPATTTTTTTTIPATTTTTTTTVPATTTTTTTTIPATTTTTTTTLPETTTTTTTTVPATTTTTTTTLPATTTTTTTTVPMTTTTATTTVPATTTTTTTTIPATTTTTPATTLPKPSLAGDANCDKTVDIADVVLIKCYIINPNEYKLSAQGFANADVHGSSNGLNAQDAVAIAKHILHVIPSLSELK